MKYIFSTVLLVFTFCFLTTSGQQSHFIYFQTENKQPFYVKLDNKIFSSSSSGYLILPKLENGSYTIRFGSPKNEWPEQTINYKLDKDAGFVFKNFGEKGWGLFNLQSLEVIMSGNDNTANTTTQEMRDDDFSKMLANVVNDSTIKQKDIIAKNDVVPKEEVKATAKEEVATVAETPQASPPETEAPVLTSVIKRNLRIKNKAGLELIYIDEYDNKKDTIRIFMPTERTAEKEKAKPQETIKEIEDAPDSSSKLNIQPDTDNISYQSDTTENTQHTSTNDSSPIPQTDTIQESPEKDTIETAKETKSTDENKMELLPAKSGMINPACKGYATEDDFMKLRRKMVAENNEENMINAAKKVFRSKCFTTENIKNLSTLFLNDEGKYNFFDAAYPHVSDTGSFSTLENQLTDSYYIKRFKAMIHE